MTRAIEPRWWVVVLLGANPKLVRYAHTVDPLAALEQVRGLAQCVESHLKDGILRARLRDCDGEERDYLVRSA